MPMAADSTKTNMEIKNVWLLAELAKQRGGLQWEFSTMSWVTLRNHQNRVETTN